MARNNTYNIPIHGLSTGFHEYEFQIKGDFLKAFSAKEIQDLDLVLNLQIDKKERFYHFFFDFEGNAKVECDRCLNPIQMFIKNHFEMMVKHSNEEGIFEEGEIEMKFIPMEDCELDIAADIYDFITLSLPMRKVCPTEDCVSFEIEVPEEEPNIEEDVDPRWAALKNLKIEE